MANDTNATGSGEGNNDSTDDLQNESTDELQLETYDLNHDGKVSPVEGYRATLGLVDARLEQIAEDAEHKGVKGHLADAAHKVVDKLDND